MSSNNLLKLHSTAKTSVPTKFTLFFFFYADKVTCDTNIEGDPKQNETITFQFGSHEVL